jgi:hypothetical protein
MRRQMLLERPEVTKMIHDLKTFVPAKDFALSRSFYKDLGFQENFAGVDVAEFQIGGYRFLLQNYYVAEYAGNFMMQLLCDDVAPWWEKINRAEFLERHPGVMRKAPELQAWGLRVMFISDPSGVLWHIADRKS